MGLTNMLFYSKLLIVGDTMRNSKGQALVEYILIIALMSIIIISLIKYFGGYLKDAITKASCNVADLEYVEGEKPGDGSCKDNYDSVLEE